MTYEMHPGSIPNDVAAELAAAEEAARQEARERIVAAVRERAAEEARVAEEAAAAAGPGAALPEEAPQDEAHGGFGRGWIPVERDIGLPGEGEDTPFTVAPAEAGAQPNSAPKREALLDDERVDGPLPAQGRRGDEVGEDQAGVAPRIWRSIDFTPPRRAMFLHHLAEQGNVRTACSLVRISPQAAYLARRRDAIFRAGWDAALVQSREHGLQVLANQALEGVREEVWHRGELVGHKVRHDTRLLLAHLGRLDARCQDARALARAERFDELLALVAGEDCGWALCDDRGHGAGGAGDEILPLTRADHSNRAVGMAYGGQPYDEPEPIDHDALIAREAAEAEWDEWGARVDAVNDALEAGEEPVVAPLPELEPELEPLGDAPPYEVKSLGGVPPRAAGRGREFFARTVCGSSTWSVGTRFPGDRAKSQRGRAGGEAALAAQSPGAMAAGHPGGLV